MDGGRGQNPALMPDTNPIPMQPEAAHWTATVAAAALPRVKGSNYPSPGLSHF